MDGFPIEKDAGQPCCNLQLDFHCCVYKNLQKQGLKGCIIFDCFGAGQKVSQISFSGQDWQKHPEIAKKMFEVFLIMRQLHELLWYQTEALTLQSARPIHSFLSTMRDETERLTNLSPDSLIKLDVVIHRANVNTLLQNTSELVRAEVRREKNSHSGRQKRFGQRAYLIGSDLRKIDLRGANLRGACLIAADLRGTELVGTDFIGADFRDADIRGADLTKSIFVTQAQINAAKGDANTKLPSMINRPTHWSHSNN
jgi:uncharacterized protein YjbI with pentapeptide repeats